MTATMPIEVCERCRRIRLVVVTLLMISTVLAGYLWGQYEHQAHRDVLLGAVGFTLLSTVLVLGVETVVTRTELQVRRAMLLLRQKDEELRILQEKVRELDRNIAMLAADDEEVRMKLLSLSVHQPRAEDARPAASPYRSAPQA